MKKYILFAFLLIFTIALKAQNPPTSANNTVSALEDNDKVFLVGDFPFNDIDGHSLVQVRISNIGGTGTLFLDGNGNNIINGGETVNNNDVILLADITDLKFRPVADENGAGYETFDFEVHDGVDGYSVASYTMTIDITAVNDEPSFTAGANQTDNEDPGAQNVPAWATGISKGHANEAAQTLTFSVSNNNNPLFSVQPDVDEITGDLTYTPAANANGSATVTVYISDDGGTANGGDDTSPSQNFTITVNAVNDPPTAAINTVSCWENSYYTFVSGNFNYSDVEADPFNQIETTTVPGTGDVWIDTDLNGQINGAEAALSAGNTVSIGDINANRLKFRPDPDENGTPYTTFNFKVHDGTEFSTLSYTMTIDVNAVNSEPSFTAGADQVDNEDPGAQNVPAWATAINKGAPDEAAQVLTFNVSNDNNGLFSVQPDVDEATGNLTYTPAANASGVANVDVYLSDNGGTANGGDDTSPTQSFTITVNAVNDPPTAAVNTVSCWENSYYTFVSGNFNYSDVESDPFNQIETTTVPGTGDVWIDTDLNGQINGAEAALSAGNTVSIGDINANRLKFRPDPDENGTPYTTFNFKVHDGTEFSTLSYTMTIDVNSINSEPSFTVGADQVDNEDPGAQNVPAWATAINKGAPDEAAQVLTFNVSNDNNGLFSVQPDVDEATGNLTYTPAANASGVANVDVYLSDNGGTANGGDDTSPTQSFTITVNAVNDPPTSAINTVSLFENNNYTFVLGNFTYNDVESDPFNQIETTTVPGTGDIWVDTDSNGQINGAEVALSAGNTVVVADITASRLKFKPDPDENGTPYTTFNFKVHDGTEFSTLSYTMTIDVNSINSEPSFIVGVDQVDNEDPGAQNVPAWATAINKGAPDEGAQTLTFNVSNDNNGLFSVQPDVDEATGNLTYTPTANASGVANVDIYLTDDGGTANGGDDTSPTQSFTITVNPVNDPPTSAINTISLFENNNYTFVLGNFTYNDIESDPFNQIETTTVTGSGSIWVDTDSNGQINGAEVALSAGNTVAIGDITSSLLKYKPLPDENGVGYTSFTFKVHDGTEFSTLSYTMTIDVTAINSEPSFTPGVNQTVNEDAGAQNVAAWATAINRGGADEGGQTLTFNISNDNNGLFSVQPDVDEATGNLTYTPTANASGVANVDIYLSDDGGTANGGDDTSPTQNFTITVNPVNDPPVLATNTGKTVNEGDASISILSTELEVTDIDNTTLEITYTLTAVPLNGGLYNGATPLGNGDSFTQADINSNSLRYTHDGGETTTDMFRFTVSDGAGGNIPVTQFDIVINPVNDDPTFTSSGVTSADEGVLYTYNIITNDVDLPGDVLTLAVPTAPGWLILTDNGDGTGDLSGTPPHGSPRSIPIVITIDDGVIATPIQQSYTIILAVNIMVPLDYPTIQQAIVASVDNDLISVSNGTYTENIDFLGKDIMVVGNEGDPTLVIIDGNLSGPVVTFESGEPATASLSGFTIQNGSGVGGLAAVISEHSPASGAYGGGIYCNNSSAYFHNLIISGNVLNVNNNHGGSGAGIYIGNCSGITIENTTIENNTSKIYRGGGICIDASDNIQIGTAGNPVIIQNNSGGNYGGGLGIYDSSVNINLRDITIQNNILDGSNGRGGGTYYHNSTITETNITKAGNTATIAGNNTYSFP